ncbi:hypothetical protein PF010_g18714 [Phytophthora fragariae]|uniref:RxLR effector protein n=1 Tax=Phytophthora fragariae TaxID=53985 RepID=A0A6G0KKB1_9STRA|nr:hypothetical protein PF010_g18714 [Phytophthora fragariae]KAE9201122.1 hypothetical protein PF004_g18800 [Phytophthora fragariae]
MRLSNTLVVVCAAVLLASGHALSETANVDHATVSKLTPSKLGASIDAITSKNRRSLRRHDDDDDVDDEEDDEEERKGGLNMFAVSKLDEMAESNMNLITRFKRWKSKGYSPYNLPQVVQADKYDELRCTTVV